jgi:hypothetical protein
MVLAARDRAWLGLLRKSLRAVGMLVAGVVVARGIRRFDFPAGADVCGAGRGGGLLREARRDCV